MRRAADDFAAIRANMQRIRERSDSPALDWVTREALRILFQKMDFPGAAEIEVVLLSTTAGSSVIEEEGIRWEPLDDCEYGEDE